MYEVNSGSLAWLNICSYSFAVIEVTQTHLHTHRAISAQYKLSDPSLRPLFPTDSGLDVFGCGLNLWRAKNEFYLSAFGAAYQLIAVMINGHVIGVYVEEFTRGPKYSTPLAYRNNGNRTNSSPLRLIHCI